jgi:cardiolipin synthase
VRRLAPILRPGAERRLPRELRAENVSSIATKLPGGVRDPSFEPLLQRIDQAPFHDGNEIAIYHRGQEAFQHMRRAIEGAAAEILLESYIFKDDATGWEVLELLGQACSRGVSVRILADAFGSLWTRSGFWREMRSRGCEVRLFHPVFPYFWHQFFRDHRKILVVDRRVGFTGGMNIAEEYGSPRSRKNGRAWRDTHARVEGPAAWELALVFSEAWHRAGGTPLEIPPLVVEEGALGARVLVLDSRPLRGHEESAAVLAAIVGSARRSVLVTNAYFAPRWVAIEVLGAAAARGVDVRLLLPGASDVPLIRHAGHGYFGELLAKGVRIFEYGAAVLHAKTMVVDGFVSVVGSTNLDFRSFRFNAECNLVVLDEGAGASMEAAFAEDLTRSEEIRNESWRRRRLGHRWGDSLARRLSPLL